MRLADDIKRIVCNAYVWTPSYGGGSGFDYRVPNRVATSGVST
jgi:hypothetical protein